MYEAYGSKFDLHVHINVGHNTVNYIEDSGGPAGAYEAQKALPNVLSPLVDGDIGNYATAVTNFCGAACNSLICFPWTTSY